jgi:hypothetical protein
LIRKIQIISVCIVTTLFVFIVTSMCFIKEKDRQVVASVQKKKKRSSHSFAEIIKSDVTKELIDAKQQSLFYLTTPSTTTHLDIKRTKYSFCEKMSDLFCIMDNQEEGKMAMIGEEGSYYYPQQTIHIKDAKMGMIQNSGKYMFHTKAKGVDLFIRQKNPQIVMHDVQTEFDHSQ